MEASRSSMKEPGVRSVNFTNDIIEISLTPEETETVHSRIVESRDKVLSM